MKGKYCCICIRNSTSGCSRGGISNSTKIRIKRQSERQRKRPDSMLNLSAVHASQSSRGMRQILCHRNSSIDMRWFTKEEVERNEIGLHLITRAYALAALEELS